MNEVEEIFKELGTTTYFFNSISGMSLLVVSF